MAEPAAPIAPVAPDPRAGAGDLYRHLIGGGTGDIFDRHVFACAIVLAAREGERSLTQALGLSAVDLHALAQRYLLPPLADLPIAIGATAGTDALEEPDLRRLLLDHRTDPDDAAGGWLAAIIARRSCRPNHLWQDLGLFNRGELSRLLLKHFYPLAARNRADMKWKKFFYRTLCAQDGIVVCKAPNCQICCDVNLCFGGEPGEPLALFQAPLLQTRQS